MREPQLLNILLSKASFFSKSLPRQHIAGWTAQYLFGVVFAMGFYMVWSINLVDVSLFSGCVMGFIAGLVGIIGWEMMFKAIGDEVDIAFAKFYTQLVVAHIIFGVVVAWVYGMWI